MRRGITIFSFISLFIYGRVLIIGHLEWISYPLVSKKDLISFKMWVTSSWKIRTTPLFARYLFTKPNILYTIIYVMILKGDNSGRCGDKRN
jgi:hypothetical protein